MARFVRRRRRSALLATVAGMAVLTAAPLAAAQQPGHSHVHTGGDAVVDGSARFEVLTPTLVRMEYAADRRFENAATFNAVDRDLPVPSYSVRREHGWLVIRTCRLTVRYQENSGPFTPANTAVTLDVAGRETTARPSWPAAPGSCVFDTVCQAEDGRLAGGESVNYDHAGFTGRGFAADYGQVTAADSWTAVLFGSRTRRRFTPR